MERAFADRECRTVHLPGARLQMLGDLELLTYHTHTHAQPFHGSLDFVRDNPGEPVPEENNKGEDCCLRLTNIISRHVSITFCAITIKLQ